MGGVMDDKMLDRVDQTVESFYTLLQTSLKFRLPDWSSFMTPRHRAEGYADRMVDASNVATELEEALAALLVIQQHVLMEWDGLKSEHLTRTSRMPNAQYRNNDEKLAPLIEGHRGLFDAKCRLDAAVDAGKRAVMRLEEVQRAASRAAGITLGG